MFSMVFYVLLLSHGFNCQINTTTEQATTEIPITETTIAITATTGNDNDSKTAQKNLPETTTPSTSIPKTTTPSTTVPKTTEATTTTITTTTTTATTTRKPCKKINFVQRIHQENPEITTLVGSNFVMDCSVNYFGGSKPTIQWFKTEEPLHEMSYRTIPKEINGAFRLVLRDLTLVDSGKYKCVVNSSCNKKSTSWKLIVVSSFPTSTPSIEKLSPTNPEIFAGKEVTFICKAKFNKDSSTTFIRWVKHQIINITATSNTSTNGTLNATTTTTTPLPIVKASVAEYNLAVPVIGRTSYIENGQINEITDLKMEQTGMSTLTIKNAKLNDTAKYICMIINKKGYVKKSTFLTVKPIPPLSKEELEEQYIDEYGKKSGIPNLLPVIFALPVFVIILVIVGCVWWYENENRKKEKELKSCKVQPASEVVVVKQVAPRSRIIIPDVIIEDRKHEKTSMCYPSSSEMSVDYSRPSTSHSRHHPDANPNNADTTHLLLNYHDEGSNNGLRLSDDWEHIIDGENQ